MEQKQDILIGRDAEKKHLESIVLSKEAEFVVVYGRRRVGKTFLVNTFFGDQYSFKLTGLAKKSKREQLANFAVSLNRYSGGTKYKKPRTWYEAFNMLRELLERVNVKGKRVVFIDELPWMDSRGSNLISALEHFWNDWAVTQKSRDIIMEDKEIAECYMIMGGIPFYLKNIRRGASLSQNIDEMFFADKGSLDDEFNALYTSLFQKSDNYIKVVQALSSKNKGLTREEILKATKLDNNGHFSTILQDLINCDFIRRYQGYGNKSKMSIYQLVDPFSLFYYKFIKNNGKTDKAFWQYQIGTRQHDTWAGLAFEQLCLNHHKQLEQALGIAVISTKVYSWTSPQTAEEKAQIDLIIKRADKVINVCEMKFYDGDYVMKKKDYDDIERRVRVFRSTNGIRQAIHPVLVTTYGLANNQYSSAFQNVVTLKDLFK